MLNAMYICSSIRLSKACSISWSSNKEMKKEITNKRTDTYRMIHPNAGQFQKAKRGGLVFLVVRLFLSPTTHYLGSKVCNRF